MHKTVYNLFITSLLIVCSFMINTKGQKTTPELFYKNGTKVINDIILNKNDTLELLCHGSYPILWKVPFKKNESTCSDLRLQKNLKYENGFYELLLLVQTVSLENIGYYKCAYVNRAKTESDIASVYVYIMDNENLFAQSYSKQLVPKIFGDQSKGVIFPCRPTMPNITMQLYNDNDQIIDDYKQSFNPKIGFTLKNIKDGKYTCIANYMDRKKQKQFAFIHAVSEIPRPIITKSVGNNQFIRKTLKLICTIKFAHETFNYITWKLPNNLNCLDHRIHIKPKFNRTATNFVIFTSILTIKNLTINDSGPYTCVSHNSTTMEQFFSLPEQQRQINITVHDKNFINLTCDNHGNITKKAGTSMFKSLIINVEAYPPFLYKWYHNGQELKNNDKIIMYNESQQVHFLLKDMQIEQSGQYTLEVFNKYAKKTIEFNFNITDSPNIMELSGPQYINSNETSNYKCIAKGNSIPTIQWYFHTKDNVTKLETGTIFKPDLQKFSNSSVLSFNTSQPGILKCEANNNFGSIIKELIISDVPGGFEVWKSEDTVIIGDSVTLYCAATLGYNLKWFLNGSEISSDNKNFKIEIKPEQYSNHSNIIFVNITREYNGDYQCNAYSTESVVKKNVSLDVQDPKPPKIYNSNLKNDTIMKINGTEFRYYCNAEGTPNPVIIWYKNKTIWAPNSNRISMADNNQSIYFERLMKEDENIYGCKAKNRYGEVIWTSNLSISEARTLSLFLFWIIVLIVGIIIMLAIYIVILTRRLYHDKKTRSELNAIVIYNKRNSGHSVRINSASSNSEQSNLLSFYSKFEFSQENLKLQEMIGVGAFGIVMKAKAFGIISGEEITTVAVKMVKRNPHIMHIKALISELKIMMHLGHHNNIVNLLGACTNNLLSTRELCVILEYCEYGNMKKYLQQYRCDFVNQIFTKETDNKKVFQPKQNSCKINTIDLFSWAAQIANGMNYLTSRRVIHGDLAARNVLLTEKKIAKICDFGLAENMCEKSTHVKKNRGMVPMKWMAIESIRYDKFSIQSDVWSFGVFLWELFSLGVEPYTDVAIDKKFYRKLLNGYKLSKPKYASDELYALMEQCWEIIPDSRPSFLDLYIDLKQMLDTLNKKIVNSSEKIQNLAREMNVNDNTLKKCINRTRTISSENTNIFHKNSEGFKNSYENVSKPEKILRSCANDYVPMAKSTNSENEKSNISSENLKIYEKKSECFDGLKIGNVSEYLQMDRTIVTDVKHNKNEYLDMTRSNLNSTQNFLLNSETPDKHRETFQESAIVHGNEYLDMTRQNLKSTQHALLNSNISHEHPENLRESDRVCGNEYLVMTKSNLMDSHHNSTIKINSERHLPESINPYDSKTNLPEMNYQNLNSTQNAFFNSGKLIKNSSLHDSANKFGSDYLEMKKLNTGPNYQNLNSSSIQLQENYLTMNGKKDL